MPGIWGKLGGFATKVIRTSQSLGRSLGETLHILRPIAPEIEPVAAARDWGSVSTFDALTPEVAALLPDDLVPRDLYVTRDVPWRGRFAYETSIYGRNLETGRFARWKYNFQSNRELTTREIDEAARGVIGIKGDSPKLEVFSLKVTGAWRSAEVEW